MKFSFVIPIYKKKATQLQSCLQSLKTQSHKNIEVIGVFDGPDETLENVFKDFLSDERFKYKVIDHGGAPKARNEGFKDATGDVISYWDSDCYAEPEMTSMWCRTFKDSPDCDFVYSGYRWTNPDMAGFESEPFDPWTLEKYNYIASMFPLKKEKCILWDESLTGLQDWDYWRRVVKAGSKGQWIRGFGFATDAPDKDSISGGYDKTKERILRIREKHEDTKKDILVYSSLYKREAIQVAKILDADYFWNPFWRVEDYKMVFMIGFHHWEIAESASLFMKMQKDTIKIVYWMGLDAEAYYNAPYHEVKKLIPKVNETVTHHFCDSKRTEDILIDIGVPVSVMTFPREEGIPSVQLPDDLRILALSDEHHNGHLDALIKALPNVHIERAAVETPYDINKYTAGIQLTQYPRLLNSSRNMLMNGRYLITNVQEPFSGYIETENPTKFKEDVIDAILALKGKRELNLEAQAYYMETTSREAFSEKIKSLLPKRLGVVS